MTTADKPAESLGGAEVITATWLFWEGYEPRVEREVFATTEPASIAAAVDGFCRAQLGSGIDHYEFYTGPAWAARTACAWTTVGESS